jgi:hypothetical protein
MAWVVEQSHPTRAFAPQQPLRRGGGLHPALERAQQFEQSPQLVRRQSPELSSTPRMALPGRWLEHIRELGERLGLRRHRT